MLSNLSLFLLAVLAKRYVVILSDSLSQEEIQAHREWVSERKAHIKEAKTFSAPGVFGYTAAMSKEEAEELRKRPEISHVEENQEYSIQVSEGLGGSDGMGRMGTMDGGDGRIYSGGIYDKISVYDQISERIYNDVAELIYNGKRETISNNHLDHLDHPIHINHPDHPNHPTDPTHHPYAPVSMYHNVLRGRRHFRRKSVKKIFRRNRKYLHPVLPFSVSREKTAGKVSRQEAATSLVFEKMHYPASSRNLEVQETDSWGLSRISQREQVYSLDTYIYPKSAGAGVSVYVLDTGVEANHPDLSGKVAQGINVIGRDLDPSDDNGHGTHCAGIIAGSSRGVAKNAKVVPVKILSAIGKGTTENTILGLVYVMKEHHKRQKDQEKPKSVVNMSLGGMNSLALGAVVKKALGMGIHIVAAGGNNAGDACDFSPASIKGVITAGATNIKDEIAQFSNTGGCVNVYAPGVDIKSAYLHSSEKSLSGTSMASPHVAGLVALYLSEEYKSPEEMKLLLQSDSFKSGLIKIASSKILNLRLSG